MLPPGPGKRVADYRFRGGGTGASGCYFGGCRLLPEKMGIGSGYPQEELIDIAVRSLGLDDFNPFDPQKKIIEYAIGERFGPLAQQKVSAFCDQVSTDSPAPGGGSVAALCGSLSASLAAMVVNLSEGKKEYRDVMPQLRENAALAQRLKDDL